MCKKVITSEFVSYGHPDKIADTIADSLLDAYLEQDKNTRAGIEVMVKDNNVVLGGEVSSNAIINYDTIVRDIFKGLDFPPNHNLNPENIKIINLIGKQSSEIHQGVDKSENVIGAGDQGFVVGFASDDTDVYMPLGHYMAKKICQWVASQRKLGLGPDTKSQVIVIRDDATYENKVDYILVSTMHIKDIDVKEVKAIVKKAIFNNVVGFSDDIFNQYIRGNEDSIEIVVNPCGSWNIGGPVSDCGVTGRKLVVDQYGGYSNIGGGFYGGKDYTKVDRSAAYMARYLAKNIVASGIAKTAKVELSYVIGVPEPSSINIELTGTKVDIDIDRLKEWIKKNIDLTPYGIMKRFDYSYGRNGHTAINGFYGVDASTTELKVYYPWEKLNIANDIKNLFNLSVLSTVL